MAGGLDGVLIFHASTGLSCSGCRFLSMRIAGRESRILAPHSLLGGDAALTTIRKR